MQPVDKEAVSLSKLITIVIEQHAWLLIFVAVLAAVLTIIIVYIVINERFSRKAKDIAETGKMMAETLKSNTETLATAPQIVTAFTALVDSSMEKERPAIHAEIGKKIEEIISDRLVTIDENVQKIRSMATEMDKVRTEIELIEKAVKDKEQEISQVFRLVHSALPDYETYKNIADPEMLWRNLDKCNNWDSGKELVARCQKLVEQSLDSPEQIPAKYIEYIGDWCRGQNQYPLALWFYTKAVERDPERIGAKVELYALQAEYVPAQRKAALNSLSEIAFSDSVASFQLVRIFNVLIEIERYQELVSICSELLNSPRYKKIDNIRAKFFRNRAVAKSSIIFNQFTDDIWEDILEAQRLDPSDENVQKIVAEWSLRANMTEKALEECKRLFQMDRANIYYCEMLARAYALNGKPEHAMQILEHAAHHVYTEKDRFRLADATDRLKKILDRNSDSLVLDD